MESVTTFWGIIKTFLRKMSVHEEIAILENFIPAESDLSN